MSPTEKALTLLNEAKELLGKEPPAGFFSAYPYYLDAKDIMEITGYSKSKVRNMMISPDFPLMRHGKRMKVQREQFFAYLRKYTNQVS